MKPFILSLLMTVSIFTFTGRAAEKKSALDSALNGIKFRSLGPAVTSGRISDIAVDPTDPNRFFVASASGGVWRTRNG